MGVGHCIVSKCADVFYQEYLPPSIRWRYGSEPWQEVVGAGYTYTTEITNDLTQNTSYQLIYRQPIITNGLLQGWSPTEYSANLETFNGISNWRMRFVLTGGAVVLTNPFTTFANGDPGISKRQCQIYCDITSQGITTNKFIGVGFGFWGLRVQQINAALRSTSCTFKIYKDGTQVSVATRAVCPQVEVIPTRLDPRLKRIEISKVPLLERVDVLTSGIGRVTDPTGISDLATDGVLVKYPIPPECLNVYKNTNDASYPVDGAPQLLPYVVPANSFIAQICSYPGTPPPEYTVSCGCKCVKCPPNTCPITCGDQVCCYDSEGRSLLTIPLSDACEDMICGC